MKRCLISAFTDTVTSTPFTTITRSSLRKYRFVLYRRHQCCLSLALALRPNFVALAFALEVWPWSKIQGQNHGRLQNSPLTSIHWSTVTGDWIILQDPRSLLTYSGQSGPCKSTWKNRISLLFIVILCIMGWPWCLSVLAFLTSLADTHSSLNSHPPFTTRVSHGQFFSVMWCPHDVQCLESI